MANETTMDDGMPDDWAAALAEQAEVDRQLNQASLPMLDVAPAPMEELSDEGAPISKDQVRKMEVILDIPVTLSMEVGRTQISIRNLLQLNQGSVVELDRLAGEPLDVLVNGTLIAHGEVVVVNEKFGIRLTDVMSAAERIKKLR